MAELSEAFVADLKEQFRRATDAQNGERVQNAIDALDQALGVAPTSSPLYGRGVRRLRRWCRTSGRLPSSYTLADAVELAGGTHPFSSSAISDVYRARFRASEVAVKVIRQHANNHESVRKSFRDEVVIWRHLRHSNIVPFLGISNLFPICVVSEWMLGGTISAFFLAHPAVNRATYIQQILHGLEFMHTLGVIHGDLKVNILVDQHRNARLVDFGMTTVLLNSSTQAITATGGSVGGTLRYMAPELHNDNPKLTVLSDIYALAITLWELFAGQTPFPFIRADHTVLLKVLAGERPSKPTASPEIGFTDSVWNVMERGWAKEPDHRPTLADFQTAIAPEMLRLRELAAARTEEQLRNLAGTLLTRENALRAGEIALREREASVRTLEEDVRQREAVLAAARKDFAREQQALAAFPAQENRSRTPPTYGNHNVHQLSGIAIDKRRPFAPRPLPEVDGHVAEKLPDIFVEPPSRSPSPESAESDPEESDQEEGWRLPVGFVPVKGMLAVPWTPIVWPRPK